MGGTVSWTRGEGPLVAFAGGFLQELLGQGRTPGAARHHLVLMGQLSRWLAGEGLVAGELTPAVARRFLEARCSAGLRRVSMAGPAPLRRCFRRVLVIELEATVRRTARSWCAKLGHVLGTAIR